MDSAFKFSFKTKTRESLSMAVHNSGHQQCEAGYQWGPALRDHFLLHQIMRGRGSFTVSGQSYHLEAGQTFVVFPGEVVSYCADETNPWEYCWVGWSGGEAVVLMEHTVFTKQTPFTTFADPKRIEQSVMDIYHASGAGLCSQTRMIGLLYLFLSVLIEESGGERPAADPSAKYLEDAIRFITHNYSSPIDISTIAASAGISRSHLYRVFVAGTGISPNQYLARFRIEQACKLLENTALPISGVANSVGFDDQLYFSRVFKKLTGKSPAVYGGRRVDK